MKSNRTNMLALFLLALSFAISSFVALSRVIIQLVENFEPQNPAVSIPLASNIYFVNPETANKLLFVVGGVYLPAMVVLGFLALKKIVNAPSKVSNLIANPWFNFAAMALSIVGLNIWFRTVLEGMTPDRWYAHFPLTFSPFHYLVGGAGLIALVMLVRRTRKNQIFPVLGFWFLFFLSLSLLLTEDKFVASYFNLYHFSYILGAVNEVIHGKIILIHTSSQYGLLYPYVVGFLASIFGYEIGSVSLFFVILSYLSYVFLFLVLGQMFSLRSPKALIYLLILVGINHTYYFKSYYGVPDENPYYQYVPIRMFFPSLFLWYGLAILKGVPQTRHYLRLLCIAIIALFWNVDTGILLMCTWLIMAVLKDLEVRFPNNFIQSCKQIFVSFVKNGAVGSIGVSIGLLVYAIYGFAKTGQLVRWYEVVEPITIYSKYGLSTLPMAGIDLWNIPIVIYISAISIGLISYFTPLVSESRRRQLIFLSVLGASLFLYYHGRSHIYGLFIVSYPALLVLLFYFDSATEYVGKWWRQWRTRSVYLGWAAVFILCTLPLLTYGLLNVVRYTPQLGKYTVLLASGALFDQGVNQPAMLQRAEYIQKVKSSDEILVLSDDAVYLHYKTGTVSPLPYAYQMEILTESQLQRTKEVLSQSTYKDIFLDRNFKLGLKILEKIDATDKNMYYF